MYFMAGGRAMSMARIVAELVSRGEEELAEELLATADEARAVLQGPYDERKVPQDFRVAVSKVVNDAVEKLHRLANQAQKQGGASDDLLNHYVWKTWTAWMDNLKNYL